MKNGQHQQCPPSMNHFISKFNLRRVLFNFIICIFAAATLVFILSLNSKDYIYQALDKFSFNLNASHIINASHLSPPPLRLKYSKQAQAPIEQIEDDEELVQRAVTTHMGDDGSNVVPKVAFMFLTKEGLGLRPLWEKFFQGHEGLFSIYVHSSPSYNGTVPGSSVFHGRRISSKAVEWGLFSMVEAERRLLANALLDSSNKRFVLLSESTIPLYNFSTIYNYLTNSWKSFVEVYDLPNAAGQGRYNPHMSPVVTLEQWRKGSQWFEMDRDLALLVVSDQKYFPVFAKFCQRYCYADEHYLPTFVHIVTPTKSSGRPVTWTDWSRPGAHPSNFDRKRVSRAFLKSVKSGHNCEYNGEMTSICFLFARKFSPDALDKLLYLAPSVLGI